MRKNSMRIYKAMALAMMMPAMLLATACSNEDNPANTSELVYSLPVTVNATHKLDNTLGFNEGDQLLVRGEYDGGKRFAGILKRVSGGTFSGTVTTETAYSGDPQSILTKSSAILLPANYESAGYLVIEENCGYNTECKSMMEKAFATSKAAAIEQFGGEKALYSDGYALMPSNVIVNFSISGLTASTDYAPSVTSGEITISGSVTSDASGNANFAVAFLVEGTDAKTYTLSIAGFEDITVTDNSPIVGTILDITKSALPKSK